MAAGASRRAVARLYTGLDVHSDHGGQFPWKSRFVDVGEGVRQAVVDEGPRGARVTFLLLHGNPTWGFLYRKFIPPLSKRHRVIVPDHVGFGRSDKPRDPSYYALERHIRNLETTLTALEADHVVPVIHDWGGPIGTGWATRHPERVAGLVVLNTWAFVKDPVMKLPWLFRFLVRGRGGWRRAVQKNIFTELFLVRGGARKLAQAEADAYRAPHPTPEDRAGIGRFAQMIPETHDTAHPDWRTLEAVEDALPNISEKPALVVWALKDPAFRKPFLDRWARTLTALDGPHRLPGAKHYLQEDAAEEILKRMEPWAAETLAPVPAKAPGARVR